MPSHEPSGLLGMGDVQALTALTEYLRTLYIKAPGLRYDEELGGTDLGGYTLVVLGGPDSNSVYAELENALRTGWRFLKDREKGIVVVDAPSGEQFEPDYGSNGEVLVDYGVILRAPNPFGRRDPKKYVFGFAGCFGFGTRAAVEFATYRRFRDSRLVSAGAPIECLVRATVSDHAPKITDVVSIRELRPPG